MFNAIEHYKNHNIDIAEDIEKEMKILSEKLFTVYYYNGIPLKEITYLVKQDIINIIKGGL